MKIDQPSTMPIVAEVKVVSLIQRKDGRRNKGCIRIRQIITPELAREILHMQIPVELCDDQLI